MHSNEYGSRQQGQVKKHLGMLCRAVQQKTTYYCTQRSADNCAPPQTIVALCASDERNKKRKVTYSDTDTDEEAPEIAIHDNILCYKHHVDHCAQ